MHGAKTSAVPPAFDKGQWEDANNIQKLEYRSLSSIIKTTERALNRCSLLPADALGELLLWPHDIDVTWQGNVRRVRVRTTTRGGVIAHTTIGVEQAFGIAIGDSS